MKYHIEVTQDCIDYGVPKVGSCPVALAMKQAGIQNPSVGRAVLFYTAGEPDKMLILPPEVTRWTSMFDNGEGVKPFSFEIEIPD